MLPVLKYLIPFYDPDVREWSMTSRMLRWLTLLWLFLGLVILFSASYPVADATGDGLFYIKRQLLALFLGIVGFNIVVRIPLKYVLGISQIGIFIVLGLIGVTLIPGLGTTANGATRWIELGAFPLQPSELMKPFLVLQSAKVFGQWERFSWNKRLIWLGIFGIILVGILLQPNLSTTALCGMTLWLVALAGGLPYIYLGGTAVLGLTAGIVSISLQDYQRRRVMSFLNPWADPMQDGYQLIQSLLAVGSGGTTGSGFGLSQQKLFYLPFNYTDFIFSVYAEEFGFIGSILLLLMLLAYASIALYVAMGCRHPVKRLVAVGVMVFLVGQSLLNIGVAIGALPTTGLPFPFFSYGGSSAVSSLVLAGLLVRVSRENNPAQVVKLPKPTYSE